MLPTWVPSAALRRPLRPMLHRDLHSGRIARGDSRDRFAAIEFENPPHFEDAEKLLSPKSQQSRRLASHGPISGLPAAALSPAEPMHSAGVLALIAGGSLTALAAVAHLACIILGAPAYRLMGAGEGMARAAEAGKLKPSLITLAISAVLVVWALYAFSGAGVIGRLPFAGVVLPAVCAVFLARAVGFPLLRPAFPENSTTFWLVSSGICLLLGALYAFGTVAVWARL